MELRALIGAAETGGRSGGLATGTGDPLAVLIARDCEGMAAIVALVPRRRETIQNADAAAGIVIQIAFAPNSTSSQGPSLPRAQGGSKAQIDFTGHLRREKEAPEPRSSLPTKPWSKKP